MILFGSCSVVLAQMNVQPGTRLVVDEGTSLRMEGPMMWNIPAGAVVVNNGFVMLGEQADLNEELGAPMTGTGIERATRTFSGPITDVNIGGTGLHLSTSQTLGPTVLERGHIPRTDHSDHTSIARWYRLAPTNNNALAAEVSFTYDPSELNGIADLDQVLHIQGGNDVWSYLPSTVNLVQRTVTTTGSDSLGTFTTFEGNLPNGALERSVRSEFFLAPNTGGTIVLHVPSGYVPRSLQVRDARGATVLVPHARSGVDAVVISAEQLVPGLYTVRVDHQIALPFIR